MIAEKEFQDQVHSMHKLREDSHQLIVLTQH
jgi:hypothetical protein